MRKIYKVILIQDITTTVGTKFFTTIKEATHYGKFTSKQMSCEDFDNAVSVTYEIKALRKPTRQKEWMEFINLHGTVMET